MIAGYLQQLDVIRSTNSKWAASPVYLSSIRLLLLEAGVCQNESKTTLGSVSQASETL